MCTLTNQQRPLYYFHCTITFYTTPPLHPHHYCSRLLHFGIFPLIKKRKNEKRRFEQILVPSLSLTHLLCHYLSCCLSPVHILSAVLSFSLSLAEDTKTKTNKKTGMPMHLMLFYSSGMTFTDTVASLTARAIKKAKRNYK